MTIDILATLPICKSYLWTVKQIIFQNSNTWSTNSILPNNQTRCTSTHNYNYSY